MKSQIQDEISFLRNAVSPELATMHVETGVETSRDPASIPGASMKKAALQAAFFIEQESS